MNFPAFVAFFFLVALCTAIPVQRIISENGPPSGAAFVHLFEWKWSDIATECESWLGPKGTLAECP